MMIKTIAFDLDDTLLDTTGILIPQTCQLIYSFLVSRGYEFSFDHFNDLRKKFVSHNSHREFFKFFVANNPQLAQAHGPGLVEKLTLLFYEPEMPEKMEIMPGMKENIVALKPHYSLYLVTAGNTSAQLQKIKSLNLDQWFSKDRQLIVSEDRFPSKKHAFEHILKKDKISAPELLSVGNRLSQEIRMAKELGAVTCYFKYGEHADDQPKDHFEIPDFVLLEAQELKALCRL